MLTDKNLRILKGFKLKCTNKHIEKKQTIDVSFHCDEYYLSYCYVSINSILKSALQGEKYHFHLLCSSLTKTDKNRLQNLVSNNYSQISFYDIKASYLPKIVLNSSYISKATYYRFFLGKLLKNVEKVICLDSDVIVTASLRELWEQPFNNYAVLACEDGWDFIHNSDHKSNLGLSKQDHYFNAGVAFYNLKHFKTNELFDLMNKISNKIKAWDQDVLNVYFKGRVGMLSPKWNCQESYFSKNYQSKVYNEKELEDAKEKPYIIQYCGKYKPWSIEGECTHPHAEKFFNYIDKTDKPLLKIKKQKMNLSMANRLFPKGSKRRSFAKKLVASINMDKKEDL